jgi:hypothetical protein
MLGRAPLRFVLITLSLVSLIWLFPAAAPAGVRHAGTLLMVDTTAGTLTLEEYWINGQRRVLMIRITSDTQVVLSERNEMFKELTDTFTTTPLHARDLRIGDFVVVELVDTAPGNVASLVMVTHPATARS